MRRVVLALMASILLLLPTLVFAYPVNVKTPEFTSCSLSGIPSNIVRGESYNVTLSAVYALNKEDAYNSGNCVNAPLDFKIELYENDPFVDDFVSTAVFNPKIFSLTTSNCNNNILEITSIAKNVILSNYEDGFPSGSAQFKGRVLRDLTKFPDEYCITSLTPVSVVGCASGACCDLTTHSAKPSGSQPTEYTDDTDGFCSGNSIKTVDYYCDGISPQAKSQETLVFTCGLCTYCSDNQLTCNYSPLGTISGCTGGQVCNGLGNCICASNTRSQCYNGDVYWYDSCNNRGEKKQECGSSTCNVDTNECDNACQPSTCSSLGKQCGSWSDGCSNTLNCGSCSSGQSCNSLGQCIDTNITEPHFTRSIPSKTQPNSNFTITYTAVGVTGNWGASIVDNVTGGCIFPNGESQISTVIISQPITTYTMTAPSSGSCIFHGDYKIGNSQVVGFEDGTITITNCNTLADINCDGAVDRNELGVYIVKWINGEVSRDELGEAIMAWVTG